MSYERRVFLVNKLIDVGLIESEQAELDELQRQPWEPKVEPPIDVKNEIRMGDLNGMIIEESWTWPGYVVTQDDIEKLARGDDPRTIGPKGCVRRNGE